jgi:hypothetical protein
VVSVGKFVCLNVLIVLEILCIRECCYCWEISVCESFVTILNFVCEKVLIVLGVLYE